MIALTGPPRIAGIERRYPSLSGWMECVWDDSESIWRLYDSGRRELFEQIVRLKGKCTYELATEQEALSLVSDLVGVFSVAPRTRLAGDPEWATEVEVECWRTTPLPATRPIYLKDENGLPRWRLAVEFESTETFGNVPGTIDGGYLLLNPATAESDGFADLGGYGRGTVGLGTTTAIVNGVARPVALVLLGDDATYAQRTRPLDGGSIYIETITP